MEVLALTVLISVVLAVLFVVLFLSNGKTIAPEQDSLLPLADGKSSSSSDQPPRAGEQSDSEFTPTTH